MKQPFVPHTLPIKSLKWEKFIHLIGNANRALARFDWLLQSIPNASVLLSPLTTKEATLSSKIEWTQATFQEVMEFEANPKILKEFTEKQKDIQEIINYRKAMQYAVEKIPDELFTNKLLKNIHKVLLDSVRWTNKDRWNFRKWQVHIWSSINVEEARFVPPAPQNIVEAMSNREKYIHEDEKDILVQLAIVHAQFEIIHPFWDWNWRLWRIILPLFLRYKKVLNSPMFYISEYLEKHRDYYYDSLLWITKDNNWEGWIEYFLKAVEAQSKLNTERVQKILDLYNIKKERIRNLTHSQYAINTLDFIFSYPVFTTTQFIKYSKIPKPTAIGILKSLSDGKVLNIIEKGRWCKPTTYIFKKLIDITN